MSRFYICLMTYLVTSILTVFILPTSGPYGQLVWRIIMGQYIGISFIILSFVVVTIGRDVMKKRELSNAS